MGAGRSGAGQGRAEVRRGSRGRLGAGLGPGRGGVFTGFSGSSGCWSRDTWGEAWRWESGGGGVPKGLEKLRTGDLVD